MVILNGKKFACSSCIKGHRSSSCAHTNRTLVEIGKKGRPPTQCSHCRELRRTSKVHSKCMCGDRPSPARQLEILPNGANSPLKSSSTDAPPDTIQLINEIFNPCSCSIGGPCCCSAPAHPTRGARANNPKKKKTNKTEPYTEITSDQQLVEQSSIPSTSKPNCCSTKSTYTESSTTTYTSPVTLPPTTCSTSIATTSFTPYSTSESLPSNTSATTGYPSPSTVPSCGTSSTSNPPTFDPLAFNTEPTLFAPQTAGTALCFCGIHCPCPGCALHDPLGLKFRTNSNTLCPTSMIIAQDCIAGLDMPTVNQLLNLTPMTENLTKSGSSSTEPGSPPPLVNLPSVSQAFGIPSLSTSPESSLSQASSYLMAGQSSTPATYDSTNNYKRSSFDAGITQSSCCSSSNKRNVKELSNNMEPSSQACCCAPTRIQNNTPTGPTGCCSSQRNDEAQPFETLNRFNLGGCC